MERGRNVGGGCERVMDDDCELNHVGEKLWKLERSDVFHSGLGAVLEEKYGKICIVWNHFNMELSTLSSLWHFLFRYVQELAEWFETFPWQVLPRSLGG